MWLIWCNNSNQQIFGRRAEKVGTDGNENQVAKLFYMALTMQSWDNQVPNYWGTVSVNPPPYNPHIIPINCPIVCGGGLGSGGGGGGGEGCRIAHNIDTISDTLFLSISQCLYLTVHPALHTHTLCCLSIRNSEHMIAYWCSYTIADTLQLKALEIIK